MQKFEEMQRKGDRKVDEYNNKKLMESHRAGQEQYMKRLKENFTNMDDMDNFDDMDNIDVKKMGVPGFLNISPEEMKDHNKEKPKENLQKLLTVQNMLFYTHFKNKEDFLSWMIDLNTRINSKETREEAEKKYDIGEYLGYKLMIEGKGEDFYKEFRRLKNQGLPLRKIKRKLRSFKSKNTENKDKKEE